MSTHYVTVRLEAAPLQAHDLANAVQVHPERIARAIGHELGFSVKVGLVYDSTEDPAVAS